MIAHQSRIERVQATLRERGIGTLLVYDRGRHDVRGPNEFFALTDFRTLGPAVLLLPVRGAPVLVISPAWDVHRARAIVGLAVAHAGAAHELPARVAAAARDLPQPVAFSGRAIVPNAVWQALLEALGADPADGEGIVAGLPAIRTPEELERIERAASIADIGFNVVRQLAKPGMREYELAAEVISAMHSAGAQDAPCRLAAAPRLDALRPPSDRRFAHGDVVVAELLPSFQGWFAQLNRTLVLGEPSEVQQAAVVQLVTAQEAQVRDAVQRMAPGMTLTADVSRATTEAGYLACADTFAIDANGPRRLTQTPLELFGRAD